MAGQNQNSAPVGIAAGIKGVAPYAILLAVFMAGFTISQALWTSSNTQLQANYQQVQGELAKVKAEYAAYQEQTAPANSLASQSTSVVASLTPNASRTVPISTPTRDPNKIEVNIREGNTADLFDGDLSISLVTTSYTVGSSNELVYRVTAALGSPGKPNLPIELQDVGYVTVYTGTYPYEIRILGADTFTANFKVTKLR